MKYAACFVAGVAVGVFALGLAEWKRVDPMTRAKFKCISVAKREHWDRSKGFLYDAVFQPVTGTSPENAAFWEATPAGEVRLSTIRADHFEVGKTYYVDFTEAEA